MNAVRRKKIIISLLLILVMEAGFGTGTVRAAAKTEEKTATAQVLTENKLTDSTDTVSGSVLSSVIKEAAAVGQTDGQAEDLQYVLGRPMTEAEREEQRRLIDEYISRLPAIEPDRTVEVLQEEIMVRAGSLPSAYDSRSESNITDVKDQGLYGTCWVFSSMSMAEASLIKQGLASRENVDLSEYHLAYYTFRFVTDPLGGTLGDNNYKSSVYSILNDGGNFSRAVRTLSSWMGVVNESAVPYSTAPAALPATIESAYGQNAAILKNAYGINKANTSLIKKAIKDYGSVGILYCSTSDSSYYNTDTAAQYCNVAYSVDHAVTIVGWDDSYSKSNFATTPVNDGAWLVKNSWGTSFGDNGYFWLSYEDATINDTVFAFEMGTADEYQNNYQYDGSGGEGYTGLNDSFQVANVFTTCANVGKMEELKAVSFDTNTANMEYSIQIYKNLTDVRIPTSGTAMLSSPKTGTTDFEGYYTVDLDETVELAYGDTFAVVISLTKSGSSVYIGRDYGGNYSTAAAEAGQSFYYNGSGWIDFGAINRSNFRIKAFTENLDQSIYTSVEIIGQEQIDFIGDTTQFTAEVYPVSAPDQSVTWTSSDESIAKVNEEGVVTAEGIGTAVISAAITLDPSISASKSITIPNTRENQVRSFVNRMYTVALNRKADSSGAAYWTSQLLSGSKDGAAVAKGFVLSPEMELRSLSNDEFVKMLYKTFFNREADASGKAYWLKLLENGVSRAYVFKGFCHSQEFTNICSSYGITRGSITLTANRDKNHNITMYVFRCYDRTLGRTPDEKGLNYWTGQILAKKKTPIEVAGGFVFSTEFKNKELSDTEYVKVLYRMFFDREYNAPGSDPNGINFWLTELSTGRRDRYKVFLGFSSSQEFKNVLETFGL